MHKPPQAACFALSFRRPDPAPALGRAVWPPPMPHPISASPSNGIFFPDSAESGLRTDPGAPKSERPESERVAEFFRAEGEPIELTVPLSAASLRLDQALAKMIPERSRSYLSARLKDGSILLNGRRALGKTKLAGGERIVVIPREDPAQHAFKPEEMDLDVIYEDDQVIVVNKPAGLVVHPAGGHWGGTLLNGLLWRYPELRNVPRAGIVHRLDKDTTGLMVVARNIGAQTDLVRQLQKREVKRLYRAIAEGVVPYDGVIDTRFGRNPADRQKMAVLKEGGKRAVTIVRVIEDLGAHTLIECSLKTGRTHQIRVHMQEAGFPLAGDPVYGRKRPAGGDEARKAVLRLGRQALHAFKLEFERPGDRKPLQFRAPPPQDFADLLNALRDLRDARLERERAEAEREGLTWEHGEAEAGFAAASYARAGADDMAEDRGGEDWDDPCGLDDEFDED